MIRTAVALASLAVMAPAGAIASPSAAHPVARYFAKVDVQVRSYRALLDRFERLSSEPPHVNVDPLVENLYRLADRFEDINARWDHITSPRGLRARHRGMGRVFTLFAEALRVHAAAVFTRHPDEILAAIPKVEARFKCASYLQYRWAAALQGALIRAGRPVPKWLRDMAALRP